METDQNIKNKTLASEIDTVYGRYIADCFTFQESFLAILHFF